MSDGCDPDDDSRRCYDLAIGALRELNIRRHNITPRAGDIDEERWWKEGPVPIPQLESGAGVRGQGADDPAAQGL